jgi:hypothetical protein
VKIELNLFRSLFCICFSEEKVKSKKRISEIESLRLGGRDTHEREQDVLEGVKRGTKSRIDIM